MMITGMDWFKRLAGRAEPVDWEAVYTAEMPRVYNYFRYLGLADAQAEDLTSDTFEKAWRKRQTYRSDKAGVTTWLLRIARNTAVDYFRGRAPEVALSAAENMAAEALPPGGLAAAGLFAAGSRPEEAALVSEQAGRLRQLLAGLPQRERELLALKYGAGLTNRTIARETGLSESNVGTILHRVITNLREQWEVSNE